MAHSDSHSGPQSADPFAELLGAGRGREHAADVLLVEDHSGYVMGVDSNSLCVFATRNRELAEQVASVHRYVSANADQVKVRRASHVEYERIRDAQAEYGPGEIDRVSSAAEEAAVLSLPWPLPTAFDETRKRLRGR